MLRALRDSIQSIIGMIAAAPVLTGILLAFLVAYGLFPLDPWARMEPFYKRLFNLVTALTAAVILILVVATIGNWIAR